jgi:hypothetical protein
LRIAIYRRGRSKRMHVLFKLLEKPSMKRISTALSTLRA